MTIEIRQADLGNDRDARAIVNLLDSYASDPRGNGQPLDENVRRKLPAALRAHPTTVVFLALDGPEPVGLAICFRGLSTFRAQPLLNVHDLAVVPARRGQGVGRALLQTAEAHARAAGCCKLTLEVQDDNQPALGLYRSLGFGDFVIAGEQQGTRYLQKSLDDQTTTEEIA